MIATTDSDGGARYVLVLAPDGLTAPHPAAPKVNTAAQAAGLSQRGELPDEVVNVFLLPLPVEGELPS
jgi:hypothetical protein